MRAILIAFAPLGRGVALSSDYRQRCPTRRPKDSSVHEQSGSQVRLTMRRRGVFLFYAGATASRGMRGGGGEGEGEGVRFAIFMPGVLWGMTEESVVFEVCG